MLIALLLALTAVTGPSLSPGDHRRTLDVDGVVRQYLIHMPVPARRGPLPLVLLLHGTGGTGARLAASTGFNREADRRGFVAVYPDARGRGWNDGRESGPDDVSFVRALLDSVMALTGADAQRIFAVGISSGAMFAYRVACELPGRVRAVSAVAGGLPAAVAERCHEGPPVSIQSFNGTADRLVPHAGTAALLSPGATAEHWARRDSCDARRDTGLEPDRDPDDSTRVSRAAWSGCAPGTDVIVYTIVGGGHSWPGNAPMRVPLLGRTTRDISATRRIAAFIAFHARPPGAR